MENAVFVTISIIGASLVLVDVYLKKTTLPVIIFYLIIGLIVGVSGLNLVNTNELGELYHLTIEVLVALIMP